MFKLRNILLAANDLIPQPTKKERECVCHARLTQVHWSRCDEALKQIAQRTMINAGICKPQIIAALNKAKSALKTTGIWTEAKIKAMEGDCKVLAAVHNQVFSPLFPIRE